MPEQATYVNPQKECDICHGPWANMCIHCFNQIGVGLGTGLGQQYRKNDVGVWVRIAG